MSVLYTYPDMIPKAEFFNSRIVVDTNRFQYIYAADMLVGEGTPEWRLLCKRFGSDFQCALLVANAVVGKIPDDWSDIFHAVRRGDSPFSDLGRTYFSGSLLDPTAYFIEKFAKTRKYLTHYPPLYPRWLVPFGFTQQVYLEYLASYWENVHDHYFRPWPTTRIGNDSSNVSQLRALGKAARREIDEVARQAGMYIKR